MKPTAVDYFACLKCSAGIEIKSINNVEESSGEIITASLECIECRETYEVIRGVPRFVDTDTSVAEDLNSGERFANSWREFSQHDGRYFQQLYDWLFPVDKEMIENKIVLEAGCGKGRHTRIISQSGAQQVFSVDIGESVDLAFENAGRLPGVNVLQADITNLPLKGGFNFVFSVGVLHHLNSPTDGFKALMKKLSNDGSICVWVYGKENNWWITNLLTPLRTTVTSKLPTFMLKYFSFVLAFITYVGSKFIARPWTDLQKKITWLPSLYYQEYLSYIAQFEFIEIHHIVFDHLTAPVAYYLAEDEVHDWFSQVEITDPIVRWHNKNSWTAFYSFDKTDQQRMISKLSRNTIDNDSTSSIATE